MKSLFIVSFLFVILSYPINIYSQISDSPIHDDGFRIFHLGDSVEKYGDDACLWFPVENIVRYKYCGKDSASYCIAGVCFNDIIMSFNSNYEMISFTYSLYYADTNSGVLRKKAKDSFNKALDYLISLYGKDYERVHEDILTKIIWVNKNTKIFLIQRLPANSYWWSLTIHFRKASAYNGSNYLYWHNGQN